MSEVERTEATRAKATFVAMLKALNRGTAYFAKVIDEFYDLPALHQQALIDFLMEKCGKERWREAAADDTRLVEVLRGVLALYAGRPEMDDPARGDLAKLVGEYTRSPGFERAQAALMPRPPTLTEVMEKL